MKRGCKWFDGWNMGFFVRKSKGKLECGVAQPQLVLHLVEIFGALVLNHQTALCLG